MKHKKELHLAHFTDVTYDNLSVLVGRSPEDKDSYPYTVASDGMYISGLRLHAWFQVENDTPRLYGFDQAEYAECGLLQLNDLDPMVKTLRKVNRRMLKAKVGAVMPASDLGQFQLQLRAFAKAVDADCVVIRDHSAMMDKDGYTRYSLPDQWGTVDHRIEECIRYRTMNVDDCMQARRVANAA